MPELPEVETTIKGLKQLIGTSIINIKIHTPKLRFLIPINILNIKDVKILGVRRRGKFILISLSNQFIIVIHLGMSGRLRLYNIHNYSKIKHDHFLLKTNKEHLLVFNDPRRFGFIDCDTKEKILKRKYLEHLGIEALGMKISGKYLFYKLVKSGTN